MRKKVPFLFMVLLLATSLYMVATSEKVVADKKMATKVRSGWAGVNRVDFGEFDSGVLSLKQNETYQIHGVAYFSGDDHVIDQVKVFFKNVDPGLRIDYNDNLVIKGKQGYFSFSVTLLSDDDRAHSFKIMVADRRENLRQLSPNSSTQTIFLKTTTSESSHSTSTDDSSNITEISSSDSSEDLVQSSESSENLSITEITNESSTSPESDRTDSSGIKVNSNISSESTTVTSTDFKGTWGSSTVTSNSSKQVDTTNADPVATIFQDSQKAAPWVEHSGIAIVSLSGAYYKRVRLIKKFDSFLV